MSRTIDLNWKAQREDFEPDGSLRDIYVLGTTAADWSKVLTMLTAPPHRARCLLEDKPAPLPAIEELFAEANRHRYRLELKVADITVSCHFLSLEQIELDFFPNGIGPRQLEALLGFMADLGDLVGKPAVLAPESMVDVPLFTYDPGTQRVSWVASSAPA